MTEEKAKLILNKLLAFNNDSNKKSAGLSSDEIEWLCDTVKMIFINQPVLLKVNAPLTVCGDIKGQFHDLLRLFELGGAPSSTNYLFLGNYVDRGYNSIETISLLFCYKVLYPNNFFMLRGKHECPYLNRKFGFYDECIANYSDEIYYTFNMVFNYLPIAAVVDDKIFCVHGGLSPKLNSLDDIKNISRPMLVPEEGMLHDLLWNNPDNTEVEWDTCDDDNSLIFNASVVDEFLEKNNFDLICRGNQLTMNGYEFPFYPATTLITIFSVPNYLDYQNKGAILKIDEDLSCSFECLEAHNT